MMKKSILILLASTLSLLFFYIFYLRDYRDNRIKKEAIILLSELEEYKTKNGKYPTSLESAGLFSPTNGKDELFYNLSKDSLNYMISYGDGLGESMVYYSDTKKWERFVGRIP